MNNRFKNLALLIFIAMLGAVMFNMVQADRRSIEDIHYSRFISLVENKMIYNTEDEPLIIQGNQIDGYYNS